MAYLLLLLSVVLATSKNLLSKAGKDEFSGLKRLVELHIVMSAVVLLVLLAASGGISGIKASPYIIGMAVLYAVATILSQLSYVKAVEKSSVSVCSLFYCCGFIIPSLWGLLYGEAVTAVQWIGFAALLISFVLSAGKTEQKKRDDKSIPEQRSYMMQWLPFCILAMICSGVVGVIQKVYRLSVFGNDMNTLLIFAFACMLMLLLLVHPFTGPVKKKGNVKRFFIYATFMGVFYAVISKLNLWLSGVLPAMVIFPALNGGAIMLTSIFSAVLLKERLSIKQKMGILLGFAAIIVIAVC